MQSAGCFPAEEGEQMVLSMLTSGLDFTSMLMYIVLDLIVIIISFSFHEWGHAYAAHRMGDDTARNLGRMTLNPMAHIDPMGMLLIFVAGFGWAKPVPVNPRNYRNYKKGEFIVSFAGIFMNLMIALVAALLSCAFAMYDLSLSAAPMNSVLVKGLCFLQLKAELPTMLYTFFYMLGATNCALAVFNFLPVYPLDGSHIFILIFGKLISPKALLWIQKNGRIILYVFLGLSILLSRVFGISIIGDSADWIYDKFVSLFSLAAGLFA